MFKVGSGCCVNNTKRNLFGTWCLLSGHITELDVKVLFAFLLFKCLKFTYTSQNVFFVCLCGK